MTAPVLARELPQLLRVEDVAARLSVCDRTVRDLVRDGALVVYRVGRAVRIDLASVEAYLCRNRVAVPQPVPQSPDPPTIEDTPDGVRVWCRPAGGRETWEVLVRRGDVPRDLVVRIAWDLRLPVDAAELLASEVLVRLSSSAAAGDAPG